MFKFVVRYLSVLKHVPLAPMIFDTMMLLSNYFFNPRLQEAIEKIEEKVISWPGVSTSIHKFGGLQFNYKGTEIGHIHSNGILDILFNRNIKSDLISKGKVEEHHVFSKSGWISFYIKNESDLDSAISLLKIAYRQKGTDLESSI